MCPRLPRYNLGVSVSFAIWLFHRMTGLSTPFSNTYHSTITTTTYATFKWKLLIRLLVIRYKYICWICWICKCISLRSNLCIQNQTEFIIYYYCGKCKYLKSVLTALQMWNRRLRNIHRFIWKLTIKYDLTRWWWWLIGSALQRVYKEMKVYGFLWYRKS